MAENKLVNVSIIFIGIVILAFVLKEFATFLRPLVLAIMITFLLQPLMKFSKRLKIPVFVTFIVLIFGLAIVIMLIGSIINVENLDISEKLPIYKARINEMSEQINSFQLFQSYGVDVKDYFNASLLSKAALLAVEAIGVFFTEIFFAIIFTIFLVPAHKKILEDLERTMRRRKGTTKEKKNIKSVMSVLEETENSIIAYLGTKSLISLGTAVVSGIILFFFGSDFVFVLAFLIFTLNFIPNIGSFIAVAIALIAYALGHGLGFSFLWLGILLILTQVLFGNILEPKFAGKKLKLDPLLIILSLFVWYWIWGVVGMILAIPITSMMKIILSHIRETKNIAEHME